MILCDFVQMMRAHTAAADRNEGPGFFMGGAVDRPKRDEGSGDEEEEKWDDDFAINALEAALGAVL